MGFNYHILAYFESLLTLICSDKKKIKDGRKPLEGIMGEYLVFYIKSTSLFTWHYDNIEYFVFICTFKHLLNPINSAAEE